MSESFKELERKLAKLPEEEQIEWILHFLEELALNEYRVKRKGGKAEWIGGRRPTQEEVSAAIEKIKELSKGNILGDDITIKELINEGRRY